MKYEFETISMIDLATVEGGTFKTAIGRGMAEGAADADRSAKKGEAVAGPLGARVGKRWGTARGFVRGFGADVLDDLKNR